MAAIRSIVSAATKTSFRALANVLVRLPTHPPEDIPNGNNRQLRGGKGNAAHQESIENMYMLTRSKIARRSDHYNALLKL